MSKLDTRVPAYVFNQTGAEIQEALNNMQRLSEGRIDELITLLQEIKAFDSGDDNETIGQQLLNIFENKADKETVETLRDIINTHKNASELDHTNESVKERHIANGAITVSKIANDAVSSEKISNGAVNEQKIDNSVMNMIRGAVIKADLDNFKSEVTNDVEEIRERLANNGGVWHYGNALTHTENASVQTDIIGATRGDFYLNIEHFYVYYTKNGEDWDYIGNLAGSVDTTQWARINSPNLEGIPTAPTPNVTNNSQQIATTEYVRNAIDKYASSNNGADIDNSTELIDNVERLMKNVYGITQFSQKISVQITNNFNLSFICSNYSNKGVPIGTWTCSDLSNLYSNIKINGNYLKHHPATAMDVTKINVTDSYLEDNYWIVYIHINTDSNDIDGYPVGALSGYSSEQTFHSDQYPYIADTTSTDIKIALGIICLPDDDVVVNGSEVILSVPAINFGNISLSANLNNLNTSSKSSLIDAINEVFGMVKTLSDLPDKIIEIENRVKSLEEHNS